VDSEKAAAGIRRLLQKPERHRLHLPAAVSLMTMEPPLPWLEGASAVLRQLLPALARLRLSLSVNPDLMIVQDVFRTRLALLQRVVPFDVARVRQLLTGTIR
jgi:hypothetical protein